MRDYVGSFAIDELHHSDYEIRLSEWNKNPLSFFSIDAFSFFWNTPSAFFYADRMNGKSLDYESDRSRLKELVI